MIKFSTKSILAIPRFFAYRNDVDIFTEDKVADKEFYKSLFYRVFQNKIQINDVTALGGKANVLTAYDNQAKESKRKKYFIIDGDLDIIIGTNRKNENNLIVLDAYCIENYLIDEDGATELIYLSDGTVSKEEIKIKLNYKKWLGYNSACLVNLFLHYAIFRKYGGDPRIRNANEFLTQNHKQTILNQTNIDNYADTIKDEIIRLLQYSGYQNSDSLYKKEIAQYKALWPPSIETLLRIVSSKNYLLPILQFRIQHCIGKGKMLFKTESIKLFLAKNSDLARLRFLQERIKA